MRNRENFDMDVSPSENKSVSNRKNGKSSKTTILVVLLCILLILSFVLVYFTFISGSNQKEVTTVEITTEEESTVPKQSSNTLSLANNEVGEESVDFKQQEVVPVVESLTSNNVAKDLGGVKREKLNEEAVKFQSHIVMVGEDLQSIASLYGLKVQTLISVNSIKNIAGVTEGASLSIPDRNGQYYIVKNGDMLSTIANKYSSTLGWKTLQTLNGLEDTKLKVGDKIFIPDMSEIASHPAMSKSGSTFIKPSGGKLIARYGQAIENNVYNEGLNLEGILLSGAGDVVSSSDGKIVDKGVNEDGNSFFLRISHKESYETVYMNLANVKVEIGQDIQMGDSLGNVALIGENKQAILYFSILQSGIPLDPESFF